MKTVNLDRESPSVGELLAMARNKSVLLVSKGTTYVLEEADDFDREVAQLGASATFMRFLEKRSKEKGVISIQEFADQLTPGRHNKAIQPTHSSAKPPRASSARKNRSPRRG